MRPAGDPIASYSPSWPGQSGSHHATVNLPIGQLRIDSGD